MLPSPPDRCSTSTPQTVKVFARAGFTLVELLASLVITATTLTVLSGVMLALSTAWDHATSMEESRQQSVSAFNRIRWMIQHAGVYRLSGQPSTIGIATVSQTWMTYSAPTALVVWSGGSNGGMAAQGTLSRLPAAQEIVIYAPDPNQQMSLVEYTFPNDVRTIDFRATSFSTDIQSLMASTTKRQVGLVNRLRVTPGISLTTSSGTSSTDMSTLMDTTNGSTTVMTGSSSGYSTPTTTGSTSGNMYSSSGSTTLLSASTSPPVSNVRFEVILSPSDGQLSGVTTGSSAWNNLPWTQGMVAADSGLRTANVRMEILLERDPAKPTTNGSYTTAFPFFGSATRRFIHHQ